MSDGDYGGARPPTFSQRAGHVPYPTEIQHGDLDGRCRTDLWNYIIKIYLHNAGPVSFEDIWADHYGLPLNDYAYRKLFAQLEQTVRKSAYHYLFDLVEWLVQRTPDGYSEMRFGTTSEDINRILARNRAGYRIVDFQVVPITNEAELSSITAAIESTSTPAAKHLKNALALFANRDQPNYAKSIQESISAAEAAAQELAGVRKPLGDSLDIVKKNSTDLHPALITGWKNLYGFTSDSGGIRHAGFDGTIQPTQELAQYFLVTCSAFVNLLTVIKSQQPT